MKVIVVEGVVMAQAETEQDVVKLLGMREDGRKTRFMNGGEKVKHKKHRFKKPCDICGKMMKNVNMHKTLKHGAVPVTPGVPQREPEHWPNIKTNHLETAN